MSQYVESAQTFILNNAPRIALQVCDFLETITTGEGGVPFVLPTVRDAPRAEWWNTELDEPPASINPTASIAGLLQRFCIAPASKQIERIERKLNPDRFLGLVAYTVILLQARVYGNGLCGKDGLGFQPADRQYFVDLVI